MKRFYAIFISIAVFAALSSAAYAQLGDTLRMQAFADKAKVAKGERFEVELTLKFKKPWYTYSLKEQLDKYGLVGPHQTKLFFLPEGALKIADDFKPPKPKSKYDIAYEVDIEYYPGTTVFRIPVIAQKDLNVEGANLQAVANIQVCSDVVCLPAEDYKTTIKFKAPEKPVEEETAVEESVELEEEETAEEVDTASSAAASESIEQSAVEDSSPAPAVAENKDTPEKKQRTKSIWETIILGMFAGLVSLTMPCVFPMIPITVSFFTNRAGKGSGGALRDAIAYALGIIGAFTAIGVLLSLIIGVVTGGEGDVASVMKNPWAYLFITGIFVFFALSLLGAYEIQMPTGLMNKLNAKSQSGQGIGSVLLMGLTFSMASFSCTGPIVGAALAEAATGSWVHPTISMLSFSTVLATPFFFLALFPKALESMPRAGAWMNNIKVVMGFIVIMFSAYYLNNALVQWGAEIPRGLFVSIWITGSLLVTTYVLGFWKTSHDADVQGVGPMRIIFSLIFGTFTIYLISGLFGSSLGELETFLPQPETTAVTAAAAGQPASHSLEWMTDYEKAKALAAAENKPMFIDFTGISCTNCKKMERLIFPKPKISSALDKYVLVKLYTDKPGQEYEMNKQMQKARFNTVAQPLYVLQSPSEEVFATSGAVFNEDKFREFLDKGLK